MTQSLPLTTLLVSSVMGAENGAQLSNGLVPSMFDRARPGEAKQSGWPCIEPSCRRATLGKLDCRLMLVGLWRSHGSIAARLLDAEAGRLAALAARGESGSPTGACSCEGEVGTLCASGPPGCSYHETILVTNPMSKPLLVATWFKAFSKLCRSMRTWLIGTAELNTRRASWAVNFWSRRQHFLHTLTKLLLSMSPCSPQKALKVSSTLPLHFSP